MPKFHKYPITEERVYIGTTNTFTFGTFEPLVTEFTTTIVTVSVSPKYEGSASLRDQILITQEVVEEDSFDLGINLASVDKVLVGSSFSLAIKLKADEERSYLI